MEELVTSSLVDTDVVVQLDTLEETVNIVSIWVAKQLSYINILKAVCVLPFKEQKRYDNLILRSSFFTLAC